MTSKFGKGRLDGRVEPGHDEREGGGGVKPYAAAPSANIASISVSP